MCLWDAVNREAGILFDGGAGGYSDFTPNIPFFAISVPPPPAVFFSPPVPMLSFLGLDLLFTPAPFFFPPSFFPKPKNPACGVIRSPFLPVPIHRVPAEVSQPKATFTGSPLPFNRLL